MRAGHQRRTATTVREHPLRAITVIAVVFSLIGIGAFAAPSRINDAAPTGALDSAFRVDPPTPPAPATTTPGVSIAAGLDPIPSNFDLSPFLNDGGGIPESSAWEPTGNFRLICEFSHFAADDPIVAPGQPGGSHLHMYFGNREADAFSTYESLRTSGDSTCQGGPVNRSAYWAPAVLDPQGRAVTPDFISVYYKGPGLDTQGNQVDVAELAPGLRMIAGARVGDPDAPSRHRWDCEFSDNKSREIPDCSSGERVGVVLPFPTCWNGTELDSPDHMSHLAYTTYGNNGVERCPGSHPVPIPELTIGIWYTHDGNSSEWYLSSDRQPGGPVHANGSSFHSDWFGAWDPDVLTTWTEECINGLLNCEGGELGDGSQLTSATDYIGPRFASFSEPTGSALICDLTAHLAGTRTPLPLEA